MVVTLVECLLQDLGRGSSTNWPAPPVARNRPVSRFRPLYYKDKSDATNAQYTRVLIYAIAGNAGVGISDEIAFRCIGVPA